MVTASGVALEPLTADALEEAFAVYAATWPRPLGAGAAERFATLIGHLRATDAPLAWIARREREPIAFAVAHRRDELWMLSALFVRPEEQVAGLGRALLRATLPPDDSVRGLIPSSGDPRASRLYATSGFDVAPTMRAHGRPDRHALPSGLAARDATLSDVELLSAIDRRVRGATRPAELALLLSDGARALVLERAGRSGYVLWQEGPPPLAGLPLTLVADDDATASALLWQAFADAGGEAVVDGLTATHAWAFAVAHAARLSLVPSGPLFTRGFAALPSPWLLSPFFG